jgi:hypothetical protein
MEEEYSFENDIDNTGDDQLLLDDDSFDEFSNDAHEAAEIAEAEKKEKKGYAVLSRADLLKEIQRLSGEVMDSLSVSSEEAFLLLRHFKYVMMLRWSENIFYIYILLFFYFCLLHCIGISFVAGRRSACSTAGLRMTQQC